LTSFFLIGNKYENHSTFWGMMATHLMFSNCYPYFLAIIFEHHTDALFGFTLS